jgi:hypothetical protein
MEKKQNKTCPSALGQVGSNLLGVVNPSGTVGFFSEPMEVTPEFLEDAGDYGTIERRFRFSNKCVQNGCKQWTGKECNVIKVILTLDSIPQNNDLPDCSIRSTCRWYFQEGANACNGCRYIVTNVSEVTPPEQEYNSLEVLKG